MNASRRYLPLSLALLLAASCAVSANAGSTLDPYSHFKPPASAKKNGKQPAAVPQADDMDGPTTFVNHKRVMMEMPPEEGAKKKGGILDKTLSPFRTAGAHVAKSSKMISNSIANGAKASTGMAKKSATVIGTGVKSTGDKIKDGSDTMGSKIARKPKKETPSKIASVDDWYSKETENAIVKNDNGERAKQLLKQDPKKGNGTQTAFLPSAKSKKRSLNPFGKLAIGKKKNNEDGVNLRPTSGFADAQMNPDEEVLTELQQEKARIAAAKKKEAAKEVITPLSEKERIEASMPPQVASTAVSKPPVKKSKFGGLNMAKFKPQMPGIPGFKKNKKSAPAQHHNAVAAAPNHKAVDVKPVKKQPVAPPAVAQADQPSGDLVAAEGTSIPDSAQPGVAFNTGDKEIDSAVAAGAPRATTNTVATKAPAAKKGGMKLGLGMPNLSMPKFSFLPKKKKVAPPNQTATKADAPKQM